MRIKKLVALATTVAMLITSTSAAFAGELTDPTGTTEPGSVDGSSTYVDTVKYKVTLPTSESLGFNIDPEGLYGYFADPDNSSETSVDGADLSGYKGKVVSTGTASVTNKSSVPVVVTCAFSVDTTANLTLKNLTDVPLDDTKKELALGINPCTYDSVNSKYTVVADNALSVVSTSTSSADKVEFGLGAADYEFTFEGGTYDYKQKATEDGVIDATYAYFQIGGSVSTDADWSELVGSSPKKVGMNCVFSYKGASKLNTGAVAADTAVVIDKTKIEYFETEPVELAANLQTITTGVESDLTAAYTVDKEVYIKYNGNFLTDDAAKLTAVDYDGAPLTITTKGNSVANGNALYFKLPQTVAEGKALKVTVDNKVYTYTVVAPAAPTELAANMQTITSGTGSDLTSAYVTTAGIYIKYNGNWLIDDASKLTAVEYDGTPLTIATKGNSPANGNAVYFKLSQTIATGKVIKVTIDEKVYTYTVK